VQHVCQEALGQRLHFAVYSFVLKDRHGIVKGTGMGEQAIDSVVIAWIVSWVVQRTKQSPMRVWCWLSEARPGVIRVFSAVLATLTVVGISWQYDPNGTLTITGLTVANGLAFVWEVLKQYVFQESGFRIFFQKPSKRDQWRTFLGNRTLTETK